MLEITVKPFKELYDSKNNRFYSLASPQVLKLEHSLLSISKWESFYHKPFLDATEKTLEEQLYYIKCMTINSGVDPIAYYGLTEEDHEAIGQYIQNPMTATTITANTNSRGGGRRSEFITSELIYYWMVAYRIPWEAQKWHLNRLMTLIEVCGIKNSPEKKMSKSEILAQNKAIRDARRAKAHSKRH